MTLKYTKNGLWVEKIHDGYRIGLSEKGQEDIGEIAFIELPESTGYIKKGDSILSVEGAKAVTEIVSPMTGYIQEIHKELENDTDKLNSLDRLNNWILELTNINDLNKEELKDKPYSV